MNIALASIAVGFTIVMLVFCLIVTLSALEDIKWRDWLTLWPYKHWISEFTSMFSWPLLVSGTLLFALVVFPGLWDARRRIAASEEGLCTCNCKKCQEAVLKADAAVQYLNLDKEDIEDLLLRKRAEESQPSIVAKPEVK